MKIHFTSLGCFRNLADTEKMMQLLSSQGHEMVGDVEMADLLVLNTCGFLKSARKEGYEMLQTLWEEKNPQAFLLVTGCMVPLHLEELKKKFGQKVDGFLSPKEEDRIVDIVREYEKKRTKRRALLSPQKKRLFTTSHSAYLKIADGCQKRCSYCIIPKIRGPLKSRTHEEILQEFHHLLSCGVVEIILVAQDLGDFGKDRREKKGLVSLLQKMVQTKGNFWIRLLYLYPDEIDEDLLSVMKSDARICPYFDLPIQHVNSRILTQMNRSFSKKEIFSCFDQIRSSFPNASLRTTLMVGFPSETEKEFQELCGFLQEVQLDHVGIFRYSNEKEAPSFSFSGQLLEPIKKRREKKLAEIQLEIVREKNRKKVGMKMDAVVEKLHPASPYLAMARSQFEAPEVDGCILINDLQPIDALGLIYPIEICGFSDYDLIGKVVEKKRRKKNDE
jgi:ribosomal protein S12 methylthiotransferase